MVSAALSACAANANEPPRDPRQGTVTSQDFFFYSCVREYMKANYIPIFDGSVAYGVEYSDLSSEVLSRLHKAAQTFARTIRAPDYSDQEHGLPAVLVVCQEEAKRTTN